MPRTFTIHDLRQRAEARLGNRKPRSPEDEIELLQLELEMQNEELRRSREELERVRDRYRELFDAAPVAYLTLDRHGRICAVNRAACALAGLSPEQLVGLRLAALMRGADGDRLHIYLRNLAHGGAKRLVIDLLASHGGSRRVALDAAVSDDGFLVVLTNANHRLDDTHQLAALGASTSTIAHEVNNLLHVIGASLETAGHDECRYTLSHCKELISRLLVVGLPDTPRTQDIEIDSLVRRTLDMLRPLVGRAIRLETALGAPAARVTCDPVELELVLINLVSNAHDAMPHGGRLSITTHLVTTARDTQSLALLVEDSGEGMSDAVQAHVFEPFFTTKAGGTGLGLATTRNIIERAHGTIGVTSTPKVGTRFEIVLPVVGAQPQRFAMGTQSRPKVTLDPPDAKKTILIVEDNSASRFAMAEHLDALGYTVVITEDVASALAAAQAQRIDLALLDYRLRSTSGELLARHLRELHPDLHVLLVSGYPRECITTTEHFLQKPFSLDDLAQAVAAAMESA